MRQGMWVAALALLVVVLVAAVDNLAFASECGYSAESLSATEPDDVRASWGKYCLPDPPAGFTWAEDFTLVPGDFYN